MGRKKPPFAPEFRQRMIELVRAGRLPEELAKEFEPSAQSIRNWVAQADRDAGQRSDGVTSAEREELVRLRRENKQYIPTWSGFLYLAVVLDVFSRRPRSNASCWRGAASRRRRRRAW